LLKLAFNATAIANLADNAASSPNTSLYVALHTADPGAGGTQSTSEASYTGYARVPVARTTGGWTASTSASTSPVSAITFGVDTSGTGTITYASVGMLASGAGIILYSGPVTPNITLGVNVTPVLGTGSTITES